MTTKKPQFSVAELKRLQKEVRRYLKTGEIGLAENVFNTMKILYRNHREQLDV